MSGPRPRRYLSRRAQGRGPVPYVVAGDAERRPEIRRPTLPPGRRRPGRGWTVASRLAGLVGLVLTLPWVLLSALLLRLSSPGPALVEERIVAPDRRRGVDRRGREGGGARRVEERRTGERRRTGRGGRLVRVFRLRTPGQSVGGGGTEVRGTPDRSGPNPVARLVRRWRLDELPALLAVARGDLGLHRARRTRRGSFAGQGGGEGD